MRTAFWALVAAEMGYVLLWRDAPIWPGIAIVSAAAVVGIILLLDPDRWHQYGLDVRTAGK